MSDMWKYVIYKVQVFKYIQIEQSQWRRSGFFIVNFEHVLHVSLVFLWLTLNK